ncbi:MAG: hypothetical protein LBJ77_02305 [Holosporales bacterium]|nr:hypothetical protein [Holosporales bacterium]
MKICSKFANKNVGKPGSTRLWGGGAPLSCCHPACPRGIDCLLCGIDGALDLFSRASLVSKSRDSPICCLRAGCL